MLTFFRRTKKCPAVEAETSAAPLSPDLTLPQSAQSLLAPPRRQHLLDQIWQRTSLSRSQFKTLYLGPLERYAALVQLLPASENHHHAYPGGMLDHGLEVVACALKLRQSHLLPCGAAPETQAAQSEAWTAAVAYAALLHDLGKIVVDVHVEYKNGHLWHPWHGPLNQPYRLRYRRDRQYRLHGAASGVIYTQILDAALLDWLSSFPELWSALLYLLAGHYEHAGELGELVMRADQASVAQALGGDPEKALSAPKHALQRKLLEGLRYLISEELKLNQPQASDGWLTNDALWLVSKTVCDKLRAHLLAQGIDGVPEKNTAVFNVLQEHGIAQANAEGKAIWVATVISENGWSHRFTFLKLAPALIWENAARPSAFSGTVTIEVPATLAPEDSSAPINDPPDHLWDFMPCEDTAPPWVGENDGDPILPGQQFMNWLSQGIRSRTLRINDAKALVHNVDNTLFLITPGLFQRYAQEHPHLAHLAKQEKLPDWEWAQKHFEQLKQHRKQSNGLNIWTCKVQGGRRVSQLHGYLLLNPGELLGELALNNPYLQLITDEPK
ncbi:MULTISPECIES: MobH family relaxase [unclassified Pseudomonas]|uniref:MobH family relaxase n=1 Tax=unclassified Pseudomonas TaxID=196821 RepID=UPI000C86CD21|nr:MULTISPECIES: MobH family relaxase [unclassified Pseudomonas]PMV17585.1 relaxase [Pseudomonas sp. FW305-3-2-15-C-TSA2]PMV18559.1 relaxase [Pseudomonas sp. DP16D-L5]PMV32310.1 relaxase [Pseudomonas sp. FW305-3-2-15-A-LB2]PMV37983.1 relaxase [Pseudomonas sp. FW305-3-2-15-C-R2A1]PMV41985.1 relaxase [Pseudomonas sp. FW305-3-2-15-C-LB1]